MNKLPAGYVDTGNACIHVARLRHHTTDLRRFMEYLPAALELEKTEVGSPESFKVVNSVKNVDSLIATVRELASLNSVLADELEKELEATP